MLGNTNIENLEEEKWAAEFAIKFSIATSGDIEELKEFVLCNFYPEEPVSRCCGIVNGNGLVDKYVRYLINKDLIVDPIQRNDAHIPCSVIARSTVDNCIVGCRIGEVFSNQDNLDDKGFSGKLLGDLPMFLAVPHKFICGVNVQSLHVDLHYSKHDAFNELKDSGDSIYFGTCLAVSSKARGKGLGAELLKRTYKLAKESGCRYTYVLASSLYSQNIFHKHEKVTVLHEAQYEDYKYDKKGRPFLLDTGVHKVLQVLAIDHGK